jgi:rhamnulokinase
MTHSYLAFDLGAESGRAILARLRDGLLDITEVARFPTQPVRSHNSVHWDVLRLWHEMQRALAEVPVEKLDSIAVDAWGVDYALIDVGQPLSGCRRASARRASGADNTN